MIVPRNVQKDTCRVPFTLASTLASIEWLLIMRVKFHTGCAKAAVFKPSHEYASMILVQYAPPFVLTWRHAVIDLAQHGDFKQSVGKSKWNLRLWAALATLGVSRDTVSFTIFACPSNSGTLNFTADFDQICYQHIYLTKIFSTVSYLYFEREHGYLRKGLA